LIQINPAPPTDKGITLDPAIMARLMIRALRHDFFQQGLSMNQTFDVQGMSCGHCERAVTQAIRAIDPQAEVKVDLVTGKVEVHTTSPREAVASAIAEEGYTVL
jgi:copper chaperone